MTLTIEAIYENGVLKPAKPLPFKEHERVQITVQPTANWVEETRGIIQCADQKLIEWAASDPELDYPPPREMP